MRASIVAVIAVLAPAARADRELSIADLKLLVQQGAFEEAYAHLDDVEPTRRNAEWTDVAAAASGGLIATLSTASVVFVIDRIDRDHPQILKSAKYTRPRSELGAKGFEACFAEAGDACMEMAVRFVDNAGGDRALALRIAKAARRGGDPRSILLFGRALAGSDRSACKDDDLRRSVLAGLARPVDDELVAPAKALLATCWPHLETQVVDEFGKETTGGAFERNTCEILKAKKLLSPLQAKVCSRRSAT